VPASGDPFPDYPSISLIQSSAQAMLDRVVGALSTLIGPLSCLGRCGRAASSGGAHPKGDKGFSGFTGGNASAPLEVSC
jgi:hypothetical protein